jgi:hypothetical protein
MRTESTCFIFNALSLIGVARSVSQSKVDYKKLQKKVDWVNSFKKVLTQLGDSTPMDLRFILNSSIFFLFGRVAMVRGLRMDAAGVVIDDTSAELKGFYPDDDKSPKEPAFGDLPWCTFVVKGLETCSSANSEKIPS